MHHHHHQENHSDHNEHHLVHPHRRNKSHDHGTPPHHHRDKSKHTRHSSSGSRSLERFDSLPGLEAAPVKSPDLKFSEIGPVIKYRHQTHELQKNCRINDVCSKCPLADRCMDRPLQEGGMLEKTEQNEVKFPSNRLIFLNDL